MTLTDNFSPITQGDVGAKFIAQFLYDDGTPRNLTGATLSMKMQLVEAIGPIGVAGTVKICTGPWTIDDASNGKAHYQYQASDVDTPGIWNIYPVDTTGGQPITFDDGRGNGTFKQLVIMPAP